MAKQYLGTKLQDLGNLNVLNPTDKIVIVQPKDEGVMELSEFFYYVQSNLDLSNYYTSAQARALFAEKANVYTKLDADNKFAYLDRTYSRVQSDAKYAPKNDVYLKSESDSRYVATDYTYGKLELYTKDETFRTFALKTEIPILPDLSPYSTTVKGDSRWAMKADTYTKIDSDGRFAPLQRSYDKSSADIRFAKAVTTYTKEETDAKFIDVNEGYDRTFIQNNIYFKQELYTKLETDTRFALKNNVYTIATINEQFAAKSWVYSRGEAIDTFAPIATTFTKVETTALVDGRVNPLSSNLSLNYYTKVNADAKYATLALTYSRLESDAKYATISTTLTAAQLTSKYYDKTQVDAKFAALDWTPFLTKTDASATYATIASTLTKAVIESKYYTRAEVNDAIAAASQGLEADSDARYITSAYADGKYSNINTVYTKTETDGKYATLDLTYSRSASDTRYYLKAQVDNIVSNSATATLGTVASIYLTAALAGNTYITLADAVATLANKTTVYTKVEADARYHVKGSSYLKAEADARFLKVGLNTLAMVDTSATGNANVLTLTNTHATNNESGRIVWANKDYDLGHVRISNTATNQAVFNLQLRPNFTTTASNVLTVTHDYIEHALYGKLHNYFATTSTTYTRAIVDGLLNDIRGSYLTVNTAASTYATIANLGVLDRTVSTLSTRVTTDRTYLDTNYYAKADIYTKGEADSRYYNRQSTKLEINLPHSGGYGTGLYLSSTGIDSPLVVFNNELGLNGSLYTTKLGEKGSVFIFETKSENGTLGASLKIGYDGINHRVYGNLHDYFALASLTYTKAEVETKISTLATDVYSKSVSDERYGLNSNLVALSTKVNNEEGRLTALTGNLSSNYYAKPLVYTKVEADARYFIKGDNELVINQTGGSTSPLRTTFSNTAGTNNLGGLRWTKGTEEYTLTTNVTTAKSPSLEFAAITNGAAANIFKANLGGLWHTAYGDLHAYFAKAAEVYTKTEVYSKTQSDLNYYSKAQSDANYHTKVVADARYITLASLTASDSSLLKNITSVENRHLSAKIATVSGWNTIAYGVGQLFADITLTDNTSIRRDTIKLSATISYGQNPSITISNRSTYYNRIGVIEKVRLLYYDLVYVLQVYGSTHLLDLKINITNNAGSDPIILLPQSAPYSAEPSVLENHQLLIPSFLNSKDKSECILNITAGSSILTTGDISSNGRILVGNDITGVAVNASSVEWFSNSISNASLNVLPGNNTTFTFKGNVENVINDLMMFNKTGISHIAYGDLHTYFAKSAETYTKYQSNDRFESRGYGYSKAESDGRYHHYTVVYTKTEADARYYNKTEIDFKFNVRDTRSDNQPPSWYYSAMPGGHVKEFKSLTAIGLDIGRQWGGLDTRIYYGDDSGGFPVQSVLTNTNRMFTRSGVSGTEWSTWAELETTANTASKYYTKTDADARYEYKGVSYSKAEADSNYYRKSDVYTKAQSDNNYYFKSETFTRGETDAKYATITAAYTKSQSDARYVYAGVSYTKAETDAKYALKTDGYTKSESDGRYHHYTVVYTKTEADSRYYDKSVVYTKLQGDVQYIKRAELPGDLSRLITYMDDRQTIDEIKPKNFPAGWYNIGVLPNNNTAAGTFEINTCANNSTAYIRFTVTATYNSKPVITVHHKNQWYGSYPGISAIRVLYRSNDYGSGALVRVYFPSGVDDDGASIRLLNKSFIPGQSIKLLSTLVPVGTTDATKVTEAAAILPANLNNLSDTETLNLNYSSSIQSNLRIDATGGFLAGPASDGLLVNPDSLMWSKVNDAIAGITVVRNANTETSVAFTGRDTSGNLSTTLTIKGSGLWHSTYGDLHTYFAKSSNTYTKAQSDANLAAATALIYSKTESDSRYFDMTQANARFAYKADSYTRAESDSRYYEKGVTYSKAQSDSRFVYRSDVGPNLAKLPDILDVRNQVQYMGSSTLSANWYTIAGGGYRGHATFNIAEISGGHHYNLEFSISITHGQGASIVLHNSSNYGTLSSGIGLIELSFGGDYDGWCLRLKIEDTVNIKHIKMSNDTGAELTKLFNAPVVSRSAAEAAEAAGWYNHENCVKNESLILDKTYGFQTTASINVAKNITAGPPKGARTVMEPTVIAWQGAPGTTNAYIHVENIDAPIFKFWLRPVGVGFTVSQDAIWHRAYGNLQDYFAKATDVYTKPQGDARYAYKADSYTKTESDNRYYTASVSDARYAYKADSYTTSVSDSRYAYKSDTYTKTQIDNRTTVIDTRSANNTPSWYQGNYAYRTTSEFKSMATIGISNNGLYGGLETSVYYGDASGGYPVQRVHSGDNRTFTRAGISGTTWSPWLELETVEGATNRHYTKAQSEGRYAAIDVALGDRYTKSQIDAGFTTKQFISDNHYHYTRLYTKEENDTNYYRKADVYTKAETDAGFTTKQYIVANHHHYTVVYTKTEADSNYYRKADVYTKSETDSRYPLKTEVIARGVQNHGTQGGELRTQVFAGNFGSATSINVTHGIPLSNLVSLTGIITDTTGNTWPMVGETGRGGLEVSISIHPNPAGIYITAVGNTSVVKNKDYKVMVTYFV